LRPTPHLEVLRAVVVSNSISMMNGLAVDQIPAKDLFRYQYVLEDVWMASSPRMIRYAHHDIARFVARMPTLPVQKSARCP
jgi:hypothetical protein